MLLISLFLFMCSLWFVMNALCIVDAEEPKAGENIANSF